ncbi:uncharacterized protein LOC131455249 [Solea solea]|uniref:uncharacterized protein LOC131455249 n=1 Tax=Solea solea TaxID=90069 RepID=UPI00272D6782|nr:uncharacterized protein LOC131455249 [Solea solea]
MMTARSFSIVIVICLNFILHQCHGFEVNQPQFQTVNPDGSATISCEYTADSASVKDVRLNSITKGNKRHMLCMKGMTHCKNITMHSENPKKWLFILLNIGPEAMDVEYECEFTVTINYLDVERKGRTPTRLQRGRQETGKSRVTPPPDSHQLNQLSWILIGLLTVIFLCGCVLACLYISLRVQKQRLCSSSRPALQYNNNTENSTYVEMRKAPPLTNKGFYIYN